MVLSRSGWQPRDRAAAHRGPIFTVIDGDDRIVDLPLLMNY
jgi:hypothetical protein